MSTWDYYTDVRANVTTDDGDEYSWTAHRQRWISDSGEKAEDEWRIHVDDAAASIFAESGWLDASEVEAWIGSISASIPRPHEGWLSSLEAISVRQPVIEAPPAVDPNVVDLVGALRRSVEAAKARREGGAR